MIKPHDIMGFVSERLQDEYACQVAEFESIWLHLVYSPQRTVIRVKVCFVNSRRLACRNSCSSTYILLCPHFQGLSPLSSPSVPKRLFLSLAIGPQVEKLG